MAELPVIPLRDLALFPGTVTPLLLGRPQSLAALTRAAESPDQTAFFTLQNHPGDEDVSPASLKRVGVVGRILNSTTLPNGLCKALVEAVASGEAMEWIENGTALSARVEPHEAGDENPAGLAGGVELLENAFFDYVNQHMDLPRGVLDLIQALPGPLEKIYGIAGHLKLPVQLRQTLLETRDLLGKLQLARDCLRNENEAAAASRRMEHEVRATIAQNQKEFFFTEQMRKLQLELGSTPPAMNQEIRKLEEELRQKGLPEKAMERALGELRRLDYLHPSSPEYSVVRTYVDWFLALPWNRTTPDRLDLAKVKAQLDADHFGLKDVKDRILEHVAVFKLARHPTTPILCLAGPPGVGKTSLGRSVAKSLGREFVRLSLGGVRDEAEIRGHRRTYIGSMPGRLVQALKKCQSMNPVILLDEIDKMGNDFRGDPASALLEVLDAEQNHDFIDHFMEVGIDLSRVFFVTTVNVEEKIPPALHDRLEVIRLSGYYDSEKLEIGKRFLLPKIRTATGLSDAQLNLSDPVMETVIRRYTREAGVRQLSRQLSKLARKRALRVVSNKSLAALTAHDLQDYLGLPTRQERLVPDAYGPGMITGLAWTSTGGETLRLECTLLSGKGRLTLTGNLGDVMKESAQIALTLARARARRFGVDPGDFQKTDIHFHVPEGAIAKDGPSAGVPILLALISAMSRIPVDPRLAFTGEISLSGKIHAVGGLPEKAIAALQAGVKRICVPGENAPEVSELPKEAKRGLKIVQSNHVDAVLDLVFGKTRKNRTRKPG